MIAYCGLRCDTCPIYLATLEPDKTKRLAMRQRIAEQASEQYGIVLTPEDINDCKGCQASADKLFSGCLVCEIRKCARNRELENCALCPDYACNHLKALFQLDPEAQTRLEEIRLVKSL